jgi:hypothetical protein
MAAETTTTALSVLSLVIGSLRSAVGETHLRKVVPSIQTNVNRISIVVWREKRR